MKVNQRAFVILFISFIFAYFVKTREYFDIAHIVRHTQVLENKQDSIGAEEAYQLASVNTGWAYPPFT